MSNKVSKIAVIAAIISVFGGALTFLMTWRNFGFAEGFLFTWISSFLLCVVCIAPIGGLIAFVVHRFVNRMWPKMSATQNSVVFGLIMATIMEAIMSMVTTLNVQGFVAIEKLLTYWLATFAAALPVGIVLSVLLSLVIKPRLMAFWAS